MNPRDDAYVNQANRKLGMSLTGEALLSIEKCADEERLENTLFNIKERSGSGLFLKISSERKYHPEIKKDIRNNGKYSETFNVPSGYISIVEIHPNTLPTFIKDNSNREVRIESYNYKSKRWETHKTF